MGGVRNRGGEGDVRMVHKSQEDLKVSQKESCESRKKERRSQNKQHPKKRKEEEKSEDEAIKQRTHSIRYDTLMKYMGRKRGRDSLLLLLLLRHCIAWSTAMD
ncbi:hypothetical protein OCU04_010684 [Sclerotinia nivalis]|uniref:Uncharacterized protein n=1 Tax=Sclerotinia nivalis TaxID=352851 RepID=A0A9X0ADH8_9HELO|nr:hypothetical protein OCU04_010684 [Sclerotinia nivalis]